VPHGILQVCIIILYENVFQNPELFPTQVSLSSEHSTLVFAQKMKPPKNKEYTHAEGLVNPKVCVQKL
jgi:hypothetical protein